MKRCVYAWQAKDSCLGDWIQVSCESPKFWTGVVVAGRGGEDKYNQWVKSFKVTTTLDGVYWDSVEDGRVF